MLSNPAAVLHGVNDMRYEDHALPETVAPGHVRVKIRALGICGSDVHFFKKACPTPHSKIHVVTFVLCCLASCTQDCCRQALSADKAPHWLRKA